MPTSVELCIASFIVTQYILRVSHNRKKEDSIRKWYLHIIDDYIKNESESSYDYRLVRHIIKWYIDQVVKLQDLVSYYNGDLEKFREELHELLEKTESKDITRQDLIRLRNIYNHKLRWINRFMIIRMLILKRKFSRETLWKG